MKPKAIDAAALPHPAMAYSQAVRCGDQLFVSGQPGIDFTTGAMSDDFEAQARQAFANLRIVLEAAGSSMDRVAKTTVWLSDPAHFTLLNQLYAEHFPVNAPARSTPVVRLPRPGLQISIEAIASV